MEMLYEKETYAIRGACFEVYKELGCGLTEACYQDALRLEFLEKNIPFVEQKDLHVIYKTSVLPHSFRVDFLCYDKIVVEIKACTNIVDAHVGQLLSYLKVGQYQLGMLVNFGQYPEVEIQRVINKFYVDTPKACPAEGMSECRGEGMA